LESCLRSSAVYLHPDDTALGMNTNVGVVMSGSIALLPYEFARQHGVLVLPESGRLLATSDAPLWAVTEIQRVFGAPQEVARMDRAAFEQELESFYRDYRHSSETVMAGMQDFIDMESAAADVEGKVNLLDVDNDAPIVRLLNAILVEALKEKASDIHIEPYENEVRVRFRLDGVLRTVLSPAVQIAPLLISRIKVMSKLDIAEKRLPQDGRMTAMLGGRSIDMRISTIPSSRGERIVMRLLDKSTSKLRVADLGMNEQDRNRLGQLIDRPHGIILVTGPTGSGKTTTLYAALQQLDGSTHNIMTVEDPVEYELPGISQTQINLRAGMTFARGLRAILRQDPDVILIGEIRDGETAEIATQASLTGHLVLATLHTNTAVGAIARLRDLGVDSFLLASTLRGVVAQRLVRRLCEHCKQAGAANEYQAQLLKVAVSTPVYRAAGCEHCKHTGFSGRLALFELIEMDTGLQNLIHEDKGEAELEKAVRARVPSIRDAGFAHVAQGITTIEEVLRVTSI